MLSTAAMLTSRQTHADNSAYRPRYEHARTRVTALGQPSPRTNGILSAVPVPAYDRIEANLEMVNLTSGEVLYEAGCTGHHVYFPTTSIVSLLGETAEGASTEICAVGKEGMIGVNLLMPGEMTCSRAVVTRAGQAYRLGSTANTRDVCLSSPFVYVMLRYMQAQITQITQAAVCNCHHPVDQRLCRRLLQSVDREPANQLTMTHEQMANILGVRRECITEWAGKLQAAGLIQYSRGRIAITDRHGLEARACVCYGFAKREWERLMASGLPDVDWAD